jgi:dienelactone hydrolase
MKSSSVASLCLAGAVVTATVSPAAQDSTKAASSSPATPPAFSTVATPAGTDGLSVKWMQLTVPGLGVMLAAVARPSGTGPFPTVLVLHGTHGFAREYVQLAEALARGGMLAVAPCWFSGGSGAGTKYVSPPIACPDAPAVSEPGGPLAVQTVDALVRAVPSLPDARVDRIGLFGHSRGSGATLAFIMSGMATTGASNANVRAAVLENGGYPPDWVDRASQVKTPVLLLHGVLPAPEDGGSPVNNVETARSFEAALKRAGRPVEAKYYEQGGHNGFFTNSSQRDDEVRTMLDFYVRHLRN